MMSEKRFEVMLNEFDEVEYIMDKEMMQDRDFAEFMDFVEILSVENEQLKREKRDFLIMYHEHLLKFGIQIPNGAFESFLKKVKK